MPSPTHSTWLTWPRLLCVGATAVLLVVVARQVEFSGFLHVLARANWFWLLPACASYLLSLWFASWRWHLALGLVRRQVHSWICLRFMFIAHFFFVALLGALTGDVVKSALYARWYRFDLPEVIAAAPLDRVLVFGGMVAVTLLSALLALAGGGFDAFQRIAWQAPGVWTLIALAVTAAVFFLILSWHVEGETAWARALRALQSGARRLWRSPAWARDGLLLATASQATLAAVFAFTYFAVAEVPVSWVPLAWTFPAITILACLPFTVAGTGVREIAAIAFWGLYGVPAEQALAASTLALGVKLALAGIGGVQLWREQTRQHAVVQRPVPKTISVIIPVLNEAIGLPETLQRVRAMPEVCETLVVDGGSRDETVRVALEAGARVLTSEPGRGHQMRAGACEARGDVVLLLHADTWLPPEGGRAALNCFRDGTVVAGGFWKRFRHPPLLLRGARGRCGARLWINRLILGDQGLFIRRETLEAIGGVPEVALMEDFELCRRLRARGRLVLACANATTSTRRFARLGVLRTYWLMARVLMAYRFGRSSEALWRLYEGQEQSR